MWLLKHLNEIIAYKDCHTLKVGCEEKIEEFYKYACEKSKDIQYWKEANEIFMQLGDYKASKTHCEELEYLAEQQYQAAIRYLLYGRECYEDYKKAAELFGTIEGYKDSSEI